MRIGQGATMFMIGWRLGKLLNPVLNLVRVEVPAYRLRRDLNKWGH